MREDPLEFGLGLWFNQQTREPVLQTTGITSFACLLVHLHEPKEFFACGEDLEWIMGK